MNVAIMLMLFRVMGLLDPGPGQDDDSMDYVPTGTYASCEPEKPTAAAYAARIALAAVLVLLAAIALAWCLNAGRLGNRPLDLAYLDISNPAEREREIERASVDTAIVKDLRGYKSLGVEIGFPNHPDVHGTAYLRSQDVAKLSVGDVIVLKGSIKYYDARFGPAIVIGDAIGVPPMSFDAKIIEILRKE